jgi:type I restriction enzyme S subunit
MTMSSDLPAGLATCGVEDVASGLFVDGDWILAADLKTGRDVRLLQLGDIGVGRFLDKSDKWISSERCNELGCTILEPGDILISRMADPIARACVVPDLGYPCITAVDVSILRPNTDLVVPEFLLLQMNSRPFRQQAEAQAAGTTRKRITRKKLAKLKLVLPPLPEQEAIMERFTALSIEVEAARHDLAEANAGVEALQSALLDAAVATAASDAPLVRLGDAIERMTSGSRDWKPYYNQGSAVFILAQNVRRRRLDFSTVLNVDPPARDPSRNRSAVERDDVLVTIVGAGTGTVARVATELPDHYVCQSVALIRPRAETLAGRYLELFLSARGWGQAAFASLMYGQGRPHLSFVDMKEIEIPLPPIERQRQVVDELEGRLAALEAVKSDVLAAQRDVEGLEDALVADALSGCAPAVDRAHPDVGAKTRHGERAGAYS